MQNNSKKYLNLKISRSKGRLFKEKKNNLEHHSKEIEIESFIVHHLDV